MENMIKIWICLNLLWLLYSRVSVSTSACLSVRLSVGQSIHEGGFCPLAAMAMVADKSPLLSLRSVWMIP